MKKNLIKSILKIALLGVVILVIYLISNLTGCSAKKDQKEKSIVVSEDSEIIAQREADESETDEPETEEPRRIFVYMCGAVNKPGVYELPSGARVFEAINMAGGLREDALATAINLASFLEDATKIYIPTVDEAQLIDEQYAYNDQAYNEELNTSNANSQGLININTADSNELQRLNGVGPKLAGAIVRYRDENGAFATKEEIKKVSGIGDGIFAKLENEITVK